MARAWHREEQPEQAAERILDAAEKTFVEVGVSAAGMGAIAEAAGCSRGTLYRYFENRHELHLAYVKRAGRAIAERVVQETGEISDPKQRLVRAILCSLREVRNDPGTAAWFAPGAAGMAARMSQSAEVIDTLTKAFGSDLSGPRPRGSAARLRTRWLVRVIVSLLAQPGESPGEERRLVEEFVVPALLTGS